jgi:BASS family bile acid:Na+ symporter
MNYLLPGAVLILMLSVGMSLRFSEITANWRRLTWSVWARLLLATFIVPPLIALALGQLLPLALSATAGLFLVAVAPGAPLMTRGVAKKGFDMQMAASYQVWGALLIPIMIPLLVAVAGKLYQRDIWIPPATLLLVIAKQQFLPLLAGMALMHFAPVFSTKVQRALNLCGNAILTVCLIALLWKMGPTLMKVSPWLPVAALLLAVGCMLVSRALLSSGTPGVQTLVISNVNRHVGLALLLSGQYVHNKSALPAIACYALAAPLVMGIYAKLARKRAQSAELATE